MTMLTDAVLVDRVVAGFEADFEELYKRHAGAAWRVAQAVTGNAHDAADAVAEAFARVFQAVKAGRLTDAAAFRAYLLTATRNASLDSLRRSGRTKPTDADDLDALDLDASTPGDAIENAGDAAMIAEAFRNLPERWRSVLWLTEVEGIATKDVADQLGISANGAAQLAVRARAGLRERFLQAHLKTTTDPECRFTVDRLGAYVGGGLAPRDIAKVDQHLAGCESCREKKAELEDLGTSLRRIVLPLPLMLGAVAGKRVATALLATVHHLPAPTAGAKILAAAKEPRMHKLVASASAAVLGLGVIAASVTGGVRPKIADLSTPAGADQTPSYALDMPDTAGTPVLDNVAVVRHASGWSTSGTSGGALELPRSAPGAAAPSTTTSGSPATSDPSSDPTPAAETPGDGGTSPLPVPVPVPVPVPGGEPIVDANVGASVNGTPVGATITVAPEPDAGIQVNQTVVGTAPEVPSEDGVTATVDPVGADPVTVSLP